MNKTMKLLTAAATAILAALATGCIMEEVGVDIVIRDTYCMDFPEYHETETFTTPDTLNLAEELNQVLDDQGLERAQLVDGAMFTVTYEVTEAPVHDWDLTGTITVERLDVAGDTEIVVNYTSQSLLAAYGTPIFADLNEDGVDLVNDAIQDYINGQNPVLLFKIENGDCDPSPNSGDPLEFEWEACVYYYAVIRDTLDTVDVFPGSE